MDRRKIIIRQVVKYGIFVLSVFILYILQSTPGFMKIFGLKPVFIVPFCITLSMLDDSWQRFIVYVIGGLLTDLSSTRVVGTFSIQLLIACIVGIIAVKFFFKPNKRNCYLFSFTAMTSMLSMEFLVSYVMRGFDSMFLFYLVSVVLLSAYSALFSIPFYHFIDLINMRFIRFDAR